MSDNVHAHVLVGYEADHFWQRMPQHLYENDALGEDAASLPFLRRDCVPTTHVDFILQIGQTMVGASFETMALVLVQVDF